jgi:hypothetical protein
MLPTDLVYKNSASETENILHIAVHSLLARNSGFRGITQAILVLILTGVAIDDHTC